jgi:hypothetical protein
MTPFAGCYPLAAQSGIELAVDWVHVERVYPVVDPAINA